MQKSIVLGIEDFKEIKKDSCNYVDKTLFIKELCDNRGKVSLFTRPRRFGKTLALSMLKTFFEAETDVYGRLADNRHYFDGLEIIRAGEAYTRHMGQYSVISLSKKPVIILELKRAEKFTQMEKICQDVLRQIDDKEYAAEFLEEGYQKILKYGVCFSKKSCVIRKSPEN